MVDNERATQGRERRHERDSSRTMRRRGFLGPLGIGRSMMRRGVRLAVLATLVERPMHGYQVIQELEARSGGRWRPSAGSIYPTLQQLEDEGLVRAADQDGRRVYTLTDAGKAEAADNPLARHPWFNTKGGGLDVRRLGMQVIGAAVQVSRVGSPDAQEKAQEILVETRRQLYRLLAEDDQRPASSAPESDGGAA